MPEFDALGRDVLAAANSTFDTDAAEAVKRLWRWAGFDGGENPNHLWTVAAEATDDGFTVTAAVKDKNVYAPEPTPAPPASAEEIARSGVDAEPPIDQPAPEAVPATPEPPVVPEVATDVAAPVEDVPTPVAATDAAVALADEHGVDLTQVEPTGASGQVIVADVKAAIPDAPASE